MKSDFFTNELNLIKDEKLKNFVIDFLENAVPDYFWVIPASSTGKYHPQQDQGEQGLLRHSRMVAQFAIDMLSLNMWSSLRQYSDEIITACILHDCAKNGTGDNISKYTIFDHPHAAIDLLAKYASEKGIYSTDNELSRKLNIISSMIETHMGQWTRDDKHNPGKVRREPSTSLEKFVHLCDYLASRKYIGSLEN